MTMGVDRPGLTKEQQIELAWRFHRVDQLSPISPYQADLVGRRAGLGKKLKARLAEAQNWRCCYCGVRMMGTGVEPDAPTFEHVIPYEAGGTNDLDNIVIACWRCNTPVFPKGYKHHNPPKPKPKEEDVD